MYDVHDFMRKKPTCIHLSMSGTQVSPIHAVDAPHNPPVRGARAHTANHTQQPHHTPRGSPLHLKTAPTMCSCPTGVCT
jgi:hypothetical protein